MMYQHYDNESRSYIYRDAETATETVIPEQIYEKRVPNPLRSEKETIVKPVRPWYWDFFKGIDASTTLDKKPEEYEMISTEKLISDAKELLKEKESKPMTPKDLPPAALYEQLAEEAVELAHAAQKMARKLRKENPTTCFEEDIKKNILEEYGDVQNVADVIGLNTDTEKRREKMLRWEQRLNRK